MEEAHTTTSPAPKKKSPPKPNVLLIPWDPDSSSHVERLRLQRIACGWGASAVEPWREMQREGKIALHWVVLQEKHSPYLEIHSKSHPQESHPLTDTAQSIFAHPRPQSSPPPTSLETFQPIGHVAFKTVVDGDDEEDTTLANISEGIYHISALYISTALQGLGLGSAAMDAIEGLVTKIPFKAKVLTLTTVANAYEGREEMKRALEIGSKDLQMSTQDWYARRGYEVFNTVERRWVMVDKTGKEWGIAAVFMRKTVSS